MKYIISLLFALVTISLSAQELPERGAVRKGNKAYLQEDFAAAAESYAKAMTYSPASFEPRFNLSNALFKGEKVEDAEKLLTEISADSLLTDLDRSNAYFNLGNTQFQQQKLKEALESYKNAMRFDPTDQEAKYNYAFTKALMEQNDQSEDQQQDDQDQENQDQEQNEDQQDQNKEQDPNSDQEQNQDQNEDQQDQGGGEDEQDQDQQPQDQQPQESQMSDQQQQQMLDAVQAQEDKTQEDMEERARGVVIQGAKNW